MESPQSTPETVQQDEAKDRASARRNFFLSTTLMFYGRAPLTARVRNLSGGGMMVELAEMPHMRQGDPLTADLRNIGPVTGEVAWVKGRRAGIKFDYEIDPELARKPVGGGEGTPDYVKPVLLPERALKYVEGLKGW